MTLYWTSKLAHCVSHQKTAWIKRLVVYKGISSFKEINWLGCFNKHESFYENVPFSNEQVLAGLNTLCQLVVVV